MSGIAGLAYGSASAMVASQGDSFGITLAEGLKMTGSVKYMESESDITVEAAIGNSNGMSCIKVDGDVAKSVLISGASDKCHN